MASRNVIEHVDGLYTVVAFERLRYTKGVAFDMIPMDAFERPISAIDRVMHDPGAFSPGSVEGVERPWYMHPQQKDNLIVLHGSRQIELYSQSHGRVERFDLTPKGVYKNSTLVYDGPVILEWPVNVFHRVISSADLGSVSVNFAIRYEGFSIKTNFHVYDLNEKTGEYRVAREGHLDQPESVNQWFG